MAGSVEVERVYGALAEAAGLVGVVPEGDAVRRVLAGHEDLLGDAVVVFSMTASASGSGGLDMSMTVPADHVDPYAFALSSGLIEATDHPVGSVISDLQERFPIGMYGIDLDVSGGFKKAYAAFPSDDLRDVSELVGVPSMPRSVGDNAELLNRYGLGTVQGVSVDYRRNEINLYCDRISTEALDPGFVRSLLRDMGLREAGEQGLEFAKRTFAIYPTLSWESSRIERICFAVITTDPATTPTTSEPEVGQMWKYATNAPFDYERRALVYGLALSAEKEYYKLGAYYQVSDHQRRLVKAFEALTD